MTYFEEGEKEFLAYFSPNDNTIKYFDFDTKKIIDKTVLEQEGPNSVGKNITGVTYINADTILVSTGTYQMSIIDKKGKLKYKKSFAKPASNQKDIIAEPNFQTVHKGIKNNQNIWIPVHPYVSSSQKGGLDNAPALYNLDIKTNEISSVMKYPDVYAKGVYGPNFSSFFYDYNTERKQLVWSFAADESLYVYDLQSKKTSSHNARSKYFNEIPPATQSVDEFEEYTKFFVLSNSYGPVYYDPYQKIYVRFVNRAISQEKYNQREWWKKRSTVILDEKFTILGEVEFSEYINPEMGFVTKKAIYFLLVNDLEDKMTFVGFKLKNISDEK
jgi:hypothetical protein